MISVHERESIFTLNDILANETDLPLYEHTTGTHGYTDLNFAFFDLEKTILTKNKRSQRSKTLQGCRKKYKRNGLSHFKIHRIC